MLKFYDSCITFSEFPDEISLCVNITNCPCRCPGCSESWLQEDTGEYLTNEAIDDLVRLHPGISLFGLMGGDSDHADVIRISDYIHSSYPALKVGMYSGRDFLDMSLLNCLDAYKIGRFILPTGDVSSWSRANCGAINLPVSNQLYFERVDNNWINATYKFRRDLVSNWESTLIK